ncbi:MAG: hypothetical protein ACYCSZ_12430 [Burkholderiales bacterium]
MKTERLIANIANQPQGKKSPNRFNRLGLFFNRFFGELSIRMTA